MELTRALERRRRAANGPSVAWFVGMAKGVLRAFVLAAVVATGVDAAAGEPPCVIHVATPPAAFGTDASTLRQVAVGELRTIDPVLSRARRRVVVTIALAPPANAGACSVSATVRDARSGALIAVIETASRASGPVSSALRRELAYTAVRSAVRRVGPVVGP